MLVLSRKQSEQIKIGDDITLTIVRIGPRSVRLGIDAPRDMPVVRSELIQVESGLCIYEEVESE